MPYRQSGHSTAGVVFFLLALFACQSALAVEPKRVMVLHSFGREVRPWSDYAQSIRSELYRQSPWPLDITDFSLISARSDDDDSEGPFVQYLRALFAKRPIDLIVSVGAPAAGFVQRHREQLFTATPMVFTAVEQRRIQYSNLSASDAVVPIRIDFSALMANILQVLPETMNVQVIVGTSPVEQFWREEIRKEAMPFADRVAFTFYDDLSFEDILKHVTAPPPHSAIFWESMIVDAAGVVHDGDAAFKRLHAASKAPIFGYYEANIGEGIVGGPYAAALDTSRQTAATAVRILGGENAGDTRITPIGFATPRFDWREMQRWGITESRLPVGSEINFREPSLWDQYRVPILAILAALLAQSALISWLMFEHRRRHLAEVQSRNAMTELTYMNRKATAGELSASIAHEVNQPLAGIATGASAALRWLRRETPDLEEVGAALEQIVTASHRASDIVTSVRSMFRKDTSERRPIDINRIILTVLAIVRIDLQKSGVELETQLVEKVLAVEGDRVQLQQVVLNLVMNAIEAMQSVQPRVLKVKSNQSNPEMVHVSIEDTGTGIDPSNLKQVFSPLFTTKERGMGMGLSICHSLIESHNGRIWVTAGSVRGTIFHFELPTKAAGKTNVAESMVENAA
jgi:signal transduction histidine kinase